MSIEINWLDDSHTIIAVHFIGEWNLQSYQTIVDASAQMMQTVANPVHLIHDFSQSHSAPRDLLAGIHYANKRLSSNQGISVLVNANSVIKAYILMAKHTGLPAAMRVYHAHSQEEALQVIQKKAQRIQTS
jgi:hypothetical protein